MKESNPKPASRTDPEPGVLRAIADKARLKLMQLISEEELSVTELVDILRLPQSSVSRHLKTLREAGLARDRHVGTTTFHTAARLDGEDDSLNQLLLAWLARKPLDDRTHSRMERVLNRRRDSSAGFFDRLGKRWDELRTEAFGETFALEAFLSLLPSTWTVADIGTGTGALIPMLSAHFDKVVAVEPADAMLECARRRGEESAAGRVRVLQGDLGRLPIEDASCDLAIACLVLHHVPQPAEALAELHRVVRPGGRVLIVEQRSHENQAFYDTMQDHWWGFEPDDLASQLGDAGFAGVRHKDLRTIEQRGAEMEAPRLFVLTGRRPGGSG